jgi:hypothetical protein
VKVYDRLRELVLAERLLCPISECVFFELFKQSDMKTRLATARVADELSQGVTLQFSTDRLQTEVAHFIGEHSRSGVSVCPLGQLVWTKVGYVLGYVYPVFKDLSSHLAGSIQKGFADLLWSCSLERMVSTIGDTRPMMIDEYGAVAEKINEGKFAHAHEIKTYKDAFLSEVWGILSVYTDTFARIMQDLYVDAPLIIPPLCGGMHGEIRSEGRRSHVESVRGSDRASVST